MAETDAQIVFSIELDDGSVRKLRANADEIAEQVGSRLSGLASKSLDRSLTGIAVQLQFIAKAAQAAFSSISGVVGRAIDEASQAEAAFSALQKSLANIGADPSGAQRISDLASELQRLGTVSDDAVVAAAQSLVTIGGLSGDALERATKAAVDLSAGLNVDLNTAFDLVAKSAAGNTAALSRYGLKIDESIPKSERFAAVLGIIEGRFNEFDQARANTFAGAIQRVDNAFSDLFESIGNFITQDKVVVAVVKFIGDQFTKLTSAIDSGFKSNGGIIGGFIRQLIQVAIVLNEAVGPAFDALQDIAAITFSAIRTGLSAVLTGLGALSLGLNEILNAAGIVSAERVARSKEFFDQQSAALIESAAATSETIKTQLSGDLPITESVRGFLTELNVAATTAPALANQIAVGTGQAIQQTAENISAAAKSINQAIGQGIVRSISGGISAVVNALVKGGNAFSAFAGAVLGIVGDIAIQIGSTLVGVGLGVEALKASLATLSGGQAIAAGLALIAIGALLKSLSGGGATSSAGVGTTGAGGGPTEAPGLQPQVQQPELERDNRQRVTVNIQGNVLDRRETGLEIAQVLQEFFDTNDGLVTRTS